MSEMNAENRQSRLRHMVLLSLFLALEIIFCFTPLGSLPITPGVVATLAHIPALLAGILLGRKSGFFLGTAMGVCSLIWWSTTGIAYPSAFAFTPFAPYGNVWSLIICLVPRMLMPVVASLLFEWLSKLFSKKKTAVAACLSALFGTLFHSAAVLSLIYICFSGTAEVAEQLGANYVSFIIAWAGVNAIAEMLVAALLAAAVVPPLRKLTRK